jgi:hypothetical protein
MKNIEKKNPSLLFLTLSCLLLTQACSPETERKEPANEEDQSINMEWVTRQTLTLTLDRMLEEEDSNEVLANATGESVDILLATGVVLPEQDGYTVETDFSDWDATNDPHPKTSFTAIDDSLDNVLNHNDVRWCGEPIQGDKFVMEYLDRYKNTLPTREAYIASITDYVDCGTGEI